jgi:hypothetical protein
MIFLLHDLNGSSYLPAAIALSQYIVGKLAAGEFICWPKCDVKNSENRSGTKDQ